MATERDMEGDPEADLAATPAQQGPQWDAWLRNISLGIVVVVMLWLVINVRLPTLDDLQAQIEGYGGFAWAAFILLYAIVAVTPIPVTVMAVTAGLLFGVVAGSVLSVVGVLIGCWAAYWSARGLGRTAVKRLLGRHASTIEKRLDSAGFEAVFTLRLMPGVPYWPVNYGSGAFGISQRDYLVASSLATIPGQVSLVAIGSFVADPSLVHASVIVGAWIIVITLTILSFRRLRKTTQS